MNINTVIIHDKAADKFVGYVKEFPGVCAQGDTMHETMDKLHSLFKKFLERALNTDIMSNPTLLNL